MKIVYTLLIGLAYAKWAKVNKIKSFIDYLHNMLCYEFVYCYNYKL